MFKRRFILVVVSFLCLSVVFLVFFSRVNWPARVVVNGQVFNVGVADTSYLQHRGLSGEKSLDTDEGMFFIFQNPGKYGFWMKNMLFPIDIVWIDQNLKIIGIEKNVSPDTYPKTFYPPENVLYVLEISAGRANSSNIKIGDSVNFVKSDSRN